MFKIKSVKRKDVWKDSHAFTIEFQLEGEEFENHRFQMICNPSKNLYYEIETIGKRPSEFNRLLNSLEYKSFLTKQIEERYKLRNLLNE